MHTTQLSFLILFTFCSASSRQIDTLRGWRTEPWPEADRLFHGDMRWLGSDGAYSVDLGRDRVLWLFGDTFIGDGLQRDRGRATMIRNSIGLQVGIDPSQASMKFFWGSSSGKPSSYVPEVDTTWFWFGDGIRLGDRLLLTVARMRSVHTGLGFEFVSSHPVVVSNPDDDPVRWNLERLEFASDTLLRTTFPSAFVPASPFLYGYFTDNPQEQCVYLVRWAIKDIVAGDFSHCDWWSPADRTWHSGAGLRRKPPPVMTGAQSEFTVHREAGTTQYTVVQSVGFGATSIGVRQSAHPEGPWPIPSFLYLPEESRRPGGFVYAAKAHPHLRGADLVLSYASNCFDFGTLVRDTTLYFPRFLKVNVSHRR